ncbi:MAG: hypothetical protein LBD24_02265 [Spirochaetaceae bacterium]|jgi:molybdopterin-guanine dinucleotide biosynthesis protein|nr:hypothetical protein [Spirochaetaceae bacterium]
MIRAQEMILIGSAGRNAGKTTLAAAFIKRWKGTFPVTALKVTSIPSRSHRCPRGGESCGACHALGGADFALQEEKEEKEAEGAPAVPDKDTARLLRAGADRVFWLRSLYDALEAGYRAFLEKAPPYTLVVCESNSLREAVDPGCFIMLQNRDEPEMKPSAARVASLADVSAAPEDVAGILARVTVERDRAGARVRVR